jgi:tartrate dehydrogenase/decarboxylase / D-malate dehydrogenase
VPNKTPKSIAIIAGDGIGPEVVDSALDILQHLQSTGEIDVTTTEYDWGSGYFKANGRMMPEDGIATLARHDAILLGAVGDPSIPDTETLWGLLIPIRREFQQYINLRPVKSLAGVRSPLAGDKAIDFLIVRENNEGEYSEIGGRANRGQATELALQTALFTRVGVERAARYAADLAASRGGKLTSATKSNGIIHTMPFWDEVVADVVAQYPGVQLTSMLIDALAAAFVLRPESFDVVVASNLFGDILSDLGSALTGSIGVAPSANLNPENDFPSLFEPVHGSAPDIAGLGVANPIGAIWSMAMMLDHLGFGDAASRVIAAFEAVVAGGVCTRDLGGSASTQQFTDAVLEMLES